ncbi:UNVERIFIED_CONTAM: E3 SUMO-protein ligase pias1 [Gekko kuhli]
MSLRVSELQVLLGYAGRNKHGRKHELLTKALHLLKAGCSPAVQMKIKELYRRRFPQKIMTSADLSLPAVHSSSMPAALSPTTIPQLAYDGHPATSPLLPVSLLGPKHELELPHLTSALHPVHPDIKLQKLPFYDLLDELIKPTSLAPLLLILCPQSAAVNKKAMVVLTATNLEGFMLRLAPGGPLTGLVF